MDKKKAISNKHEWLPTCNRYVAYIDIMGFKDMIARMPHNEIYKTMMKVAYSKAANEVMSCVESDATLVKTTTYSDSIMIYSRDESNDSLKAFMSTVSGLAYDLLVECCIPYKGSVAFGLMTLDITNSIFFGQPLIDAYLLQEELYFYGIIIHGSAEQKMKDSNSTMDYVIEFSCPLKNGHSNHFSVRPEGFISNDLTYEHYKEEIFDSIKKLRYKTSGYLRKYIDNTEQYLEYIKNFK
jgi:hypothetical protein